MRAIWSRAGEDRRALVHRLGRSRGTSPQTPLPRCGGPACGGAPSSARRCSLCGGGPPEGNLRAQGRWNQQQVALRGLGRRQVVGGDDAAGQGGVTLADGGQRFARAYTMHAPGIAVLRWNELQLGQELVAAAFGHAQRIAPGTNPFRMAGFRAAISSARVSRMSETSFLTELQAHSSGAPQCLARASCRRGRNAGRHRPTLRRLARSIVAANHLPSAQAAEGDLLLIPAALRAEVPSGGPPPHRPPSRGARGTAARRSTTPRQRRLWRSPRLRPSRCTRAADPHPHGFQIARIEFFPNRVFSLLPHRQKKGILWVIVPWHRRLLNVR